VQTEAPGTSFYRSLVSLNYLVVPDAIFSLDRIADNLVPGTPLAGIVTEANQFRERRYFINHRDIIEIQDTAAVSRSQPE
jgi:hypothetical protein